jgi:hypothetical protein
LVTVGGALGGGAVEESQPAISTNDNAIDIRVMVGAV